MKLSEHEIFKYVTQHIMDPQLWAIALDLQILIDQQEKEIEAFRQGRDRWHQRWCIAYDILDTTQRRQYEEEIDAPLKPEWQDDYMAHEDHGL